MRRVLFKQAQLQDSRRAFASLSPSRVVSGAHRSSLTSCLSRGPPLVVPVGESPLQRLEVLGTRQRSEAEKPGVHAGTS